MEGSLSRALARAVPRSSSSFQHLTRPEWACRPCRVSTQTSTRAQRNFTTSPSSQLTNLNHPPQTNPTDTSAHAQPAAAVSQNVGSEEKNHFDRIEAESKDKQMRSPWMRNGSDRAPVHRNRSAGAMTKGKLLTTPSRMLKLILPLTTRDANKDRKDVEPLALLVHPQQPLSYLERLIQSELPVLKDGEKERIPGVTFRAQDTTEEDIGSGKSAVEEAEEESEEELEGADHTRIDGRKEKTGKIKSSSSSDSSSTSTTPSEQKKDASLPTHAHREPNHASHAPDPDHPDFVRWSPSTEIGDFIRDAAAGKEFAVDIEGAPPIYVGVPSFNDRTYYLRMRLRKTAKRILQQADIKKECDQLAQSGAQRVAQGGFAALIGWWAMVYYLTFQTNLGWDVMEPVTYLVGLSGIMGGYMWFLYNNREVSYRSALNYTVSRRQDQLYKAKGFDIQNWEMLVEEGNRLRREIKLVAEEYDVEWDETSDAEVGDGEGKVSEALRKARRKRAGRGDKDGDGKEDKDQKKGGDKDDD